MQLLRTRPRLLQTRLLQRILRLRRLLLSKYYLTYDEKDIGCLANVFFTFIDEPGGTALVIILPRSLWESYAYLQQYP